MMVIVIKTNDTFAVSVFALRRKTVQRKRRKSLSSVKLVGEDAVRLAGTTRPSSTYVRYVSTGYVNHESLFGFNRRQVLRSHVFKRDNFSK